MKHFVATLLMLSGFLAANAQKGLGKPYVFDIPLDYSNDESKGEEYVRIETKIKSNKEGWFVVSDREDNPIYDKPGINGSQVRTAEFREWFYVVDEEKDYVKVVKASGVEHKLKLVNVREVSGWMRKQNLLLWNSVLHDPSTRAPRRVFLANYIDDIQNEEKHDIIAFNSPRSNQNFTSVRQLEYYHVLKIEPRTGRYLISNDEDISSFNTNAIIGWVESRRCIPINTRIFLEPNFDSEAFQERKNNPNLRVKLFKEEAALRNNEINSNAIVPYKDIAAMQQQDSEEIDEISKSNPRRLTGAAFRMPFSGLLRDNIIRTFVIDTYEDTISNSKVKLIRNVYTP